MGIHSAGYTRLALEGGISPEQTKELPEKTPDPTV
jgi:hypothetical protein